MTQILQAIPNGFAQIPSSDRVTLDIIASKLSQNRHLLPNYDNLYVGTSSYTGTTREMFELFAQLDRLMYNIGIESALYKELYFTIENNTISGMNLVSRIVPHDAIASTRIIVDRDFSSTDTFTAHADDFTELKTINLHLQETNRHLVRVFKTDNTLIVLTNKITWKMIFKIKALNCKLFEDQFLTYNTDVEKAYTALATDNLDEFHKRIAKILNYKTWYKYKRIKLAECFKTNKTSRLAEKTDAINNTKYNIDAAEEKYKVLLMKLRRLTEEYNLLLNSEETVDIDEILDYIDRHHYIKDVNRNGTTTLEFLIEAPLIYFDEDYIEDYKAYPTPNMKYVMEEVFLKKKYRLWAQSRIQLNTANFRTGALHISPTNNSLFPQPHLSRYGCQGNHPDQIRKWIANYDYIGCIEQIMVMACNLNWTDGIVIQEMFTTINRIKDCKTFEVVETGEFVSYSDILATMEEA